MSDGTDAAPGSDEVRRFQEETLALRTEVDVLRREASDLRAQRDAAWEQIQTMRRSASWRLTWPLRRLARGRR